MLLFSDKRKKSPILIHCLVLSALAATPVVAQSSGIYHPITARELYLGIMEGGLASWVQDPAQRSALSTAMATAYVLGTADSQRDKKWCPNQRVHIQAMTETVLDYLADLPQNRQEEDAATIVSEALGKSYPCQ
ncbi:Rap1a/Tai family immunity protein [Samsonia erythrinae]|uniref:Rap1a/Tai family immunity protein n=1 Tax=Samsonia erythrinae TaxID=160434 RepID=UPI001053BF21|nr:Rap1a/Tai family immunity protein [Samsonia erythrinae]